MEAERRQWLDAGFSEEVTNTACSYVRKSSRAVYDSRWTAYCAWCKEHGFRHPSTLSSVEVLNFLQEKARSVQPSTVAGYITAISRRHVEVKLRKKMVKLSELPSVRTWLKGLNQTNTAPPTRVPQWDLGIVLSALRKPPYCPLPDKMKDRDAFLRLITLRTVFLVAITSARRASEVHALLDPPDFGDQQVQVFTDPNFIMKINTKGWHADRPIVLPGMAGEDDPDLRKLCVRKALLDYSNATLQFRGGSGASQLFLCYGKAKRGQPVSKVRISEWLKMVVKDAYARLGLPPPTRVKGHDTRKQSTSWAVEAGVDPQKICDAATWKCDSTFARAYKLQVAHRGRSEFGRSVLRAATSTRRSAEHSLEGALGKGRRSSLQGYRIPKLSDKEKR